MPARIIERSLKAYAATRSKDLPYRHILVDQSYPINKTENRADIRRVCAELGVEVLDPGQNLGLHGGFNWALRQLGPQDDDIVIGYDGDSMPISPGWDMALVRAILGCRTHDVVWSSLMNPRSEVDILARGYDRTMADGFIELHLTRTAVMNSVCAWRFGWLRSVGYLDEPLQWYGHLESCMWGKLAGKRWAFLPGWREVDDPRDDHDRGYIVYKWHVAHLMNTKLDFESWLVANGYDLMTGIRPDGDPAAPRQNP